MWLFLLLTACGPDITDQLLQGRIGGAAWTFGEGETDPFLSEGEETWFVQLYGEPYLPCGFSTPGGPALLLALPREPGRYRLHGPVSLTFVPAPGVNLVAAEGEIVVEEVGEEVVTGRLWASYDRNNEVEGRFAASLCSDAG